MADWFARLMQKGRSHPRRVILAGEDADVGKTPSPRDARYDVIVQMLRDRDVDDREAREKRQRGYRQSLESDAAVGSGVSDPSSPARLHKFRTKVPCRTTPEARALLDEIRKRFPGSSVTFPQVTNRQQAVMLTRRSGAEPKQIGWIEHCVQTDPKRCNVRDQGLEVETDGGSMLVMRFRYPPTAVRMSSRRDADRCVDFTEIRPALDLRPTDKGASPRLVWLKRPEAETMNALKSREYEAFYVRFKLEILAGIWSSLSSLLSASPGSQWHQGSCYSLVREPDATNGRIFQRTLDDSGRPVDIGADRIYNAAPATDILLLFLEGDILADFADIYFTLQSLSAADAYFLKEEFFTVIRRFWASSQSLASRYGSDLPAVVRMSQRTLPTPAQSPLLKQDWTNLRQSLVDRYGEGGRKAADLVDQDVHRPRSGPPAWPFASFPPGEVNVGLRLVYRQEWRHLANQRGEVIRTVPAAPVSMPDESSVTTSGTRHATADRRTVETIFEQGDNTPSLDRVVDEVIRGTVEAMKWPLDCEGSINTGARGLASRTNMGLESECRASSRDMNARLTDIAWTTASKILDQVTVAVPAESEADLEQSASTGIEKLTEGAAGYSCSRLQSRFEVLTRPAEIQNVILVAEKLPTPAEIDLAWVRRHDWILSRVLLDESFRDALDTIGQGASTPEQLARFDSDTSLETKRDRLCEHLRANILHYQQAVWQQEDPQQRSMRYRKMGKKVPLEWRFELESGGALTIDELGDRLSAMNVDGQFAAYSAGREADLDQVIDPAGPIGYYGNYAVYHMRPEFGSEELFSMLHFFKSPYLRPNPETGDPEVADPEQIQSSQDPALVAADDRAFRRERTRRLTVDTGGLVIDIIRDADVASEKSAGDDGDIDVCEPPHDSQLIVESGCEMALLRASGGGDAESEWAFLQNGEARMAVLRAGDAATGTVDPENEPAIHMRVDGAQIQSLRSGQAPDPEDERMILAGDDQRLRLAGAHGGGAQMGEQPLLSESNDERSLGLRIGLAHDPEAERLILDRADAALRLTGVVPEEAARAREPAILAESDEDRAPTLLAGGVHAVEQLILAGREQDRALTLHAGEARDPKTEPAIFAREEGEGMPTLRAGDVTARTREPAIVASGDGGDGARPPGLLAGAGLSHAEGPLILSGADEGLPLTMFTGGPTPQDDERAILADSDGLRRPRLLAGAGARRPRQRVILAREAEWLRPSLVAG